MLLFSVTLSKHSFIILTIPLFYKEKAKYLYVQKLNITVIIQKFPFYLQRLGIKWSEYSSDPVSKMGEL